jgi:Arc/MetJ-type ribon-helix-helix transcriptional regulator
MPAHHTLHVALTAPLVDYVRKQVSEGQYPNPSQVVRAALELHARDAGSFQTASSQENDKIDD